MTALTRNQADLTVRHLTGMYYDETIPDGHLTVDNTEPRFGDFVRQLSWQIGADLDRDYVLDVVEAFDALADDKEGAATDLNEAVNITLDSTGKFGLLWIKR